MFPYATILKKSFKQKIPKYFKKLLMKKKKAWHVYKVTKSYLNKAKYRNICKICKTEIMLLKIERLIHPVIPEIPNSFFSLLIISLVEVNHQL